MYQIAKTDGTTTTYKTRGEAIVALGARYPELATSLNALTGGRDLYWACDSDAENDDGAHAVAVGRYDASPVR